MCGSLGAVALSTTGSYSEADSARRGLSDAFKTGHQPGTHHLAQRSDNAACRKSTARWLADGQVRQEALTDACCRTCAGF
jgi:hypothetical protein